MNADFLQFTNTCSESDPRVRVRSGFEGGFASDAMTGFFLVAPIAGKWAAGGGCDCASTLFSRPACASVRPCC